VLELDPDRLALYGYAHVPWVSKRQQLIDEDALPRDTARHQLAVLAAEMLVAAGYDAIGIDHFAKPHDGLAIAATAGRLRRNFQGYTDDVCPTLIGLGASSISRYPTGYVQNASATAAYEGRISSGTLAGAKGHAFTQEDKLRARAIEMLMCDFALDMGELRNSFGDAVAELAPEIAGIMQRFEGLVTLDETTLRILTEGRPLARIVASAFDAYRAEGVRYSQAS
jgi:oxygen-independent coproporphyrinogen-3 oxidase